MTTAIALALGVASFNASALDVAEVNGTKISVGGFFKANGIFGQPDNADNTFNGSAQETRIGMNVANSDVEGHSVMGRIEYDFVGPAGSELRLRQAFMKVDDFTFGKFVNGQALALIAYNGEQFDVRGTGMGTAFGHGNNVRPDLVVHYEKNGLRLSAHDPIYDDADYPDMVVGYNAKLNGGHGFGGFISAREVRIAETSDSDVGVGAGIGARIAVSDASSIGVTAYYGEGMGAYSGIGVDGRIESTGYRLTDAATLGTNDRADSENGDLVSQFGYTVSFQQKFTDRLRGNIRVGIIEVDDAAETTQEDYSANLIYTAFSNFELGMEVRDRRLLNHPTRPAGSQVELMAMYKF